MTYTIAARCQTTGKMGMAIATYSLVAGQLCRGVQANIGIAITQAFPRQANQSTALRLLGAGFSAAHVLRILQEDDPHAEYRQTCVMGRSGRPAVFTGAQARGWAGHLIEEDLAAFGNVLADKGVLDAMSEAFTQRTGEALEHRLLAALEAGRNAGGQAGLGGHLPERSAAIVVVDREDYPELDLRVDFHPAAVDELRRLYEAYRPYHDYYRLRATAPGTGLPQEEFQARLDRQRSAHGAA